MRGGDRYNERMNPRLVPLLLVLAWLAPVSAATIHLYDGSMVNGEIVRFEDGIYTLASAALGEIRVAEDDIARIDFAETSLPKRRGDMPAMDPGQVRDIQHGMALDPNIFGKIRSLQDDPQVQAVLNDPEVVQAMRSGNYAALLANPGFMALLNHPEIRSITRDFLDKR